MNNKNKLLATLAFAALGIFGTGCVSEGYATGYSTTYTTYPAYVGSSYSTSYGYVAPVAVETTIIDVAPPPPPPPPPRHVGHRYHGHHAPPPSIRHRPAGHRPEATRKPAKPQAAPRTAPPRATAKPNPTGARPATVHTAKPNPTAARPATPRVRSAPSRKGGRPAGTAPSRRKK